VSGNTTAVQANINNNMSADFSLNLIGQIAMIASYFGL
jgi:hypothetical protein